MEHDTRSQPTTTSRAAWFAFGIGTLFLIIHLAVSFNLSNWFWGFNHYFFLPRIWSIILLAAGSALCVPWVMSGLLRHGSRLCRLVCESSARRVTADIAVTGLLAAAFWSLRASQHFLGDGRLLIRLLNQGSWVHPHEPLDHMIHYGVLRVAQTYSTWNAETVYAVVSVAAGALYVIAALRLGRLMGQKLFLTTFLLGLGTIQLFFGYAESYSLATAVILIYIVLALEHLSGQRSLVWPAVALIIGVALHHGLVFLIPSCLYLIWTHRGPAATRIRNISRVAAFSALTAILVLSTSWGSGVGRPSLLIVPWSPDAVAQYTLLSWKHLVDLMNEQMLISPLGWIAACIFAGAFLRSPILRQLRRFRFLCIASLFPFLFTVLFRPGLGGSRDWDLWSLWSLPYVVAGACWIAHRMNETLRFRYAAYVMVIVGLVHVMPWVYVNHNPRYSLEHFQSMLEDNPLWTARRIAAAKGELGSFYFDRDGHTEAGRMLRQAIELAPDLGWLWRGLANCHFRRGKIDSAEVCLQRAVELDPYDAEAHSKLGQLYVLRNQTTKAEVFLQKAIELEPRLAHAHFSIGVLLQAEKRFEEAAQAYRRATELRPSAPAYWYHLALTLEEIEGRREEAVTAWQQVLRLVQDDPSQYHIVEEAQKHLGIR